MSNVAHQPVSVQQGDADDKWFRWQSGLIGHLSGVGRSALLDISADYDLQKFFAAYGAMRERNNTHSEMKDYLVDMPPEAKCFVCEEQAEDADLLLQTARGEADPTYTPQQLSDVAVACLKQAQALMKLASRIEAGEFAFPAS